MIERCSGCGVRRIVDDVPTYQEGGGHVRYGVSEPHQWTTDDVPIWGVYRADQYRQVWVSVGDPSPGGSVVENMDTLTLADASVLALRIAASHGYAVFNVADGDPLVGA